MIAHSKKIVILFLMAFLAQTSYSQIRYQQGYYIDNNDQRIDCLIYGLEWYNNPTEFTIKLNDSSKPESKKISQVKEFSITGSSRFIRAVVDMDESTDNIDGLTNNRNPIWKKDSAFLRILVDGKATLYSYTKSNLFRYFYKTEQKEITQLIYKRFLTTNGIVAENNSFQQQLFNDVKCPKTTIQEVRKVRYKDNSLVKYFIGYLECNGESNQTTKPSTKKRNLTISAIIGRQLIRGGGSSFIGAPVINSFTQFGVELEYNLYSRNKWSFFIEPNIYTTSEVNFISIPIGLRHYFFINDDLKLFLNVSVFGPFYSPETKFIGVGIVPPFVGGGIAFKRFRLEGRIPVSSSENSLSTIMVGYSFYKKK